MSFFILDEEVWWAWDQLTCMRPLQAPISSPTWGDFVSLDVRKKDVPSRRFGRSENIPSFFFLLISPLKNFIRFIARSLHFAKRPDEAFPFLLEHFFPLSQFPLYLNCLASIVFTRHAINTIGYSSHENITRGFPDLFFSPSEITGFPPALQCHLTVENEATWDIHGSQPI